MTFTVEDGTGLAAANALATVAAVDAYHALRCNTDWNGSDTAKQAAIVKATDYIERRWGPRLRGRPSSSTQALAFPRAGLHDERGIAITGVPGEVVQAVAEYAVRALVGTELDPDRTRSSSGKATKRDKVKVGPIELDVELGAEVSQSYPKADRLMRTFARAGGTYR